MQTSLTGVKLDGTGVLTQTSQSLEFAATTTVTINITVTGQNGSPINLSGSALVLSVRTSPYYNAKQVLSLQATIDNPTAGTAHFIVPNTAFALAVGAYVYDVTLIAANGNTDQVVPIGSLYITASSYTPGQTITPLASQQPLALGPQGAPGAGLPNTVTVSATSLDDLGAKINAADTSLGTGHGVIFVPPGTYNVATPVSLSPKRRLSLGRGLYTSTVTNSPTWLFQDDTIIEGDGWGTILQETTADITTGYALTVMWAKATYLDTTAVGPNRVIIRDLRIQGANPSWTGSSASTTLMLGNGNDIHVERVFLDRTKTLGIVIGGSSINGNFAQNIWIKDCKFYQVASQNVSCVNGENIHIHRNTFQSAGQVGGPGASYIDFEPNAVTDRIHHFEISNNVFDARGAANPGNGIVIQDSSGRAYVGTGTISGNLFIGGATYPQTGYGFTYMSTAVYLVGQREVNVVGNTIQRMGGCGINLDTCHRCTVVGNLVMGSGGGGIPTISVGGTYNVVKSNSLTMDPNSGTQDSSITEAAGADYNTIADNFLDSYLEGGGLGGVVTLVGVNSIAYDNVCNRRRTNQSSSSRSVNKITTSSAVGNRDDIILVDTTAGIVTVTLPDATEASATKSGRQLVIKRVAGTNNVSIATTSAQTIDGAAAPLTVSDNTARRFVSDGANWQSI